MKAPRGRMCIDSRLENLPACYMMMHNFRYPGLQKMKFPLDVSSHCARFLNPAPPYLPASAAVATGQFAEPLPHTEEMRSLKQSAVVIGGTGAVGSALLAQILTLRLYRKVLYIGRRPLSLPSSPGVEVVRKPCWCAVTVIAGAAYSPLGDCSCRCKCC